jgi:RNA polymerase sigma-70 factor (ECF subfamily)
LKLENTIYNNDRELIAAILNGDRQAFAVFVRQTENLVAKIIFQMTGGNGDRKDLAQEIYIKAYQSLGDFQFRAKLSTWIGQIAYYTCLHHLKKKKLNYLEEIPEESEQQGDYGEAELRLFNADLSGILAIAILDLPSLYQTLITLFHEEELSYAEIMEVTGLPEGTIKNYLFRARRMLRDYLLKRYDREEL